MSDDSKDYLFTKNIIQLPASTPFGMDVPLHLTAVYLKGRLNTYFTRSFRHVIAGGTLGYLLYF